MGLFLAFQRTQDYHNGPVEVEACHYITQLPHLI